MAAIRTAPKARRPIQQYSPARTIGDYRPDASMLRREEAARAADSPWAGRPASTTSAESDAQLQARIEAILESGPVRSLTGGMTHHVHCAVSDGRVRLFGTVRQSTAARIIEDAVRRRVASDAIENEIRVLGPRCGD